MLNFRAYVEARENIYGSDKDLNQIKRLGLKNVQVYKHTKRPLTLSDLQFAFQKAGQKDEVLYCILNLSTDSPAFKKFNRHNGQPVVVDEIYGENEILVSLLDGYDSEGISIRVRLQDISLADKQQKSHGRFLAKTFFHRKDYVSPDESKDYLVLSKPEDGWKLREILDDLVKCKEPHCQGLVKALQTNILDRNAWFMAADILDDMRSPKINILRQILAKNQ